MKVKRTLSSLVGQSGCGNIKHGKCRGTSDKQVYLLCFMGTATSISTIANTEGWGLLDRAITTGFDITRMVQNSLETEYLVESAKGTRDGYSLQTHLPQWPGRAELNS